MQGFAKVPGQLVASGPLHHPYSCLRAGLASSSGVPKNMGASICGKLACMIWVISVRVLVIQLLPALSTDIAASPNVCLTSGYVHRDSPMSTTVNIS